MFCVVNLFCGSLFYFEKRHRSSGVIILLYTEPNTIKYIGDFCPLYAIVTSSIHGPVNAL